MAEPVAQNPAVSSISLDELRARFEQFFNRRDLDLQQVNGFLQDFVRGLEQGQKSFNIDVSFFRLPQTTAKVFLQPASQSVDTQLPPVFITDIAFWLDSLQEWFEAYYPGDSRVESASAQPAFYIPLIPDQKEVISDEEYLKDDQLRAILNKAKVLLNLSVTLDTTNNKVSGDLEILLQEITKADLDRLKELWGQSQTVGTLAYYLTLWQQLPVTNEITSLPTVPPIAISQAKLVTNVFIEKLQGILADSQLEFSQDLLTNVTASLFDTEAESAEIYSVIDNQKLLEVSRSLPALLNSIKLVKSDETPTRGKRGGDETTTTESGAADNQTSAVVPTELQTKPDVQAQIPVTFDSAVVPSPLAFSLEQWQQLSDTSRDRVSSTTISQQIGFLSNQIANELFLTYGVPLQGSAFLALEPSLQYQLRQYIASYVMSLTPAEFDQLRRNRFSYGSLLCRRLLQNNKNFLLLAAISVQTYVQAHQAEIPQAQSVLAEIQRDLGTYRQFGPDVAATSFLSKNDQLDSSEAEGRAADEELKLEEFGTFSLSYNELNQEFTKFGDQFKLQRTDIINLQRKIHQAIGIEDARSYLMVLLSRNSTEFPSLQNLSTVERFELLVGLEKYWYQQLGLLVRTTGKTGLSSTKIDFFSRKNSNLLLNLSPENIEGLDPNDPTIKGMLLRKQWRDQDLNKSQDAAELLLQNVWSYYSPEELNQVTTKNYLITTLIGPALNTQSQGTLNAYYSSVVSNAQTEKQALLEIGLKQLAEPQKNQIYRRLTAWSAAPSSTTEVETAAETERYFDKDIHARWEEWNKNFLGLLDAYSAAEAAEMLLATQQAALLSPGPDGLLTADINPPAYNAPMEGEPGATAPPRPSLRQLTRLFRRTEVTTDEADDGASSLPIKNLQSFSRTAQGLNRARLLTETATRARQISSAARLGPLLSAITAAISAMIGAITTALGPVLIALGSAGAAILGAVGGLSGLALGAGIISGGLWLGSKVMGALGATGTTSTATPTAATQLGAPEALDKAGSGLADKAKGLLDKGQEFAKTLASPSGVAVGGTTVVMAAGALYSQTMIAGSFLDPQTVAELVGESSPYVEIKKTASPEIIANGETADVTYTITITPKGEYQITPVPGNTTDAYTTLGGQLGIDLPNPIENVRSQLPSGPISAGNPVAITYTVPGVRGTDTQLTNTFDFHYTVAGVEGEQNLRTAAFVTIGNPEVGCFEFMPTGSQFGGQGRSVAWAPDEIAEIRAAYNRPGAVATYNQLVCGDGPIKMYRMSSSQYGGFVISRNEIGIYDLGIKFSVGNTQYTLVHELGHIMDGRNSGLRNQFVAAASNERSCYSYPYAACQANGNWAPGEAFSEAMALYVVAGSYPNPRLQAWRLDRVDPEAYNWIRENIFDGVVFY